MTARLKRRGRRRKGRNKHRTKFGQLVYYSLGGKYDAVLQKYFYKPRFFKRMFPNYELALMHLTNVELGIIEEDYVYRFLKVHKIVGGYRQGGQKYITCKRIISEPEKEWTPDERSSMGRTVVGSGQPRQFRKSFVSVPKVVDTATWADATDGGLGWSSWTREDSFAAASMDRDLG